MPKAPAFQFYVRDWLSDPQLRMASPSTRGIWIDLLCFMWDAPERGVLKTTTEKLGRMVGATNGELDRFFEEAKELSFCDISGHVTNCHEIVTITNRRMSREEKQRQRWADRKRKERSRKGVTHESRQCHAESASASASAKKELPSNEGSLSPSPTCPHQKIIDLFHTHLPELPDVKVWGETSSKNLRARWREDPERQNMDWWKRFFDRIRGSDFLMGRKSDWQASLTWIVGPKNFEKIMNGNYDNRGPQTGSKRTDKNIRVLEEFINDL